MKTLLFQHISDYCKANTLVQPNTIIIVGLSGGPDSVFLLHYLHAKANELNLRLIAAHLDHGWRERSKFDAQFCGELAHQLGIPIIVRRLDELALVIKRNGSQEEVGRKARRFFFEQVRQKYNANAIALAHHADDQQETFFIRLLRGASLTGLTAMKPLNGYYIRPLLTITKKEIVDYLNAHGISYCIDETNATDQFLRNRIRNAVIPALHQADSRFSVNFAKTIEQLQQTEQFLETMTQQSFDAIKGTGIHEISVDKFLALEPLLQQRILIYWFCRNNVLFTPSQALFNEIIRFLHNKSSTHSLYKTWQLTKKGPILRIVHR